MRKYGGKLIYDLTIKEFEKRVAEHMKEYGEVNAKQGKDEFSEFKSGISDRTGCVRIPIKTV
jgi:hypothetical protein